MDMRERILGAARLVAQAHGYGGLNFRDLAAQVGIKSASLHYHFPTKADLGAAVAQRYVEDSQARLDALWDETRDATEALRRYPALFRRALEDGNRMCLSGFMAAEHDDVPAAVREAVVAFTEVHVAWLESMVALIEPAGKLAASRQRAEAIFAAIWGAQLLSRGRAEIAAFDHAVEGYRRFGLLPG